MSQFALKAAPFKEMMTALKPHAGADETRPVLTFVRVRFAARHGQVAFDATDSYSALRAKAMVDDALLSPSREDFDVLVPAAKLFSLRPQKDSTVIFDVARTDVWGDVPDEEGVLEHRVVEGGYSEITDGITTVRLDHFAGLNGGLFPELDEIIGESTELRMDVPVFRASPRVIGRMAKLPGVTQINPTRPNAPIIFLSSGEGRDDYSPPEYQGAVMPVRTDEDEEVRELTWEAWAS